MLSTKPRTVTFTFTDENIDHIELVATSYKNATVATIITIAMLQMRFRNKKQAPLDVKDFVGETWRMIIFRKGMYVHTKYQFIGE